MTAILLSLIAGLVLFLFAVGNLSKTIQRSMGDKASYWIQRYTSTIFSGILVGTGVTALLGSSSAVIIIAIVLVNALVLPFRHAMGLVLGANIGTTVSSQLIALDVGKYSPVLLLIGFLLLFLSKSERTRNSGKIIFFFGLLFFGLLTMETAVAPLKEEAFFFDWMKKTENPLRGTLTGALVTLLVQSSSATVGMAIVLAKQELLSTTGGLAIMLGAELGTCSDTLIATIRGNAAALKTGLFHVTFNLLSLIVGLLFFFPFVHLVKTLSADAPIERIIANGHLLFNLLGVAFFAWTIPLFERVLNRLLPDRPLTDTGLSGG